MPSLVTNVLRCKDLLNIQLEFINLQIDASNASAPLLRRIDDGEAFIVVRLPPQHIAEMAFATDSSSLPPYQAFLSSPSRIAVALPRTFAQISFTVENVLRLLTELTPITDPPSPNGRPTTVVEFPDRLLLVPHATSRLFHRFLPVQSSVTNWTEIWNTSLGENQNGQGRFRAIPNPVDRDRFAAGSLASLTAQNRADIVQHSSRNSSKPDVIMSSRFALTALGAFAELKSTWPSDLPILKAWEHDACLGRDQRVRTVEPGYLFPFGHRASLETITQREFASGLAKLVQHQIVTVQESERNYDDLAEHYIFKGREMPLKRIKIVSQRSSGILANQDPVQFNVMAADGSGNLINCDLSMLFVSLRDANNLTDLQDLERAYTNQNKVMLDNQRVAFADDRKSRNDSSLTVEQMTIDIQMLDVNGAAQPPFLPRMRDADVRIPAIEHLLGSVNGGSRKATTISLHKDYLSRGFTDGDSKQVFAKFATPAPPLSIPAERGGGLAFPKFPSLDGLSRAVGPVADVDGFMLDKPISPLALIRDAKLLGVIPLSSLLPDEIPAATGFPIDEADTLFEKIEDPLVFISRPVLTSIQVPTGIETRFLWKPELKTDKFPVPLAPLPFPATDPIQLTVKGRVSKRFSSVETPAEDSAHFEVNGKLRNFSLAFGQLLTISFKHIEFLAGAGRKMDVQTEIGGVAFGPDLAFVQTLQKLLPIGGLGKLPDVQPLPDGVVVSYGVSVPSFPAFGFSIQNVAVVSTISLPFVEGRPVAVRFSLSERSNPFLVTVAVFGGTGFFAVEVRTDGIIQVEAAIEFGGIVSLNLLDIVRGGVYLLAGIFVSIQSSGQRVIGGHLRFGGFVDVLGLVAVSIEFFVALTYEGAKLVGEGRVTFSVKVLFLNESFSFRVRQEIAAFGAAPAGQTLLSLPASSNAATTTDAASARPEPKPLMNEAQWEKYCKAFS